MEWPKSDSPVASKLGRSRESPDRFIAGSLAFLICLVGAWIGCSTDYRDLSTANGRKAVIEEANNFLTSGLCDEAINTLLPLVNSPYHDYDSKFVYSSAYACKGGLNFPALLLAVKDVSGSDIWTPLIKANNSASSADGKVSAMAQAASILRTTTPRTLEEGNNYYTAQFRTGDVNSYMIFLQASVIGLTISPSNMGNAHPDTGAKRTAITGLGTDSDKCRIQVAVATIANCLTYVSTGTAIDTVSDSIQALCGGTCPTNLNPSVCTGVEIGQGATLITALDSQWST